MAIFLQVNLLAPTSIGSSREKKKEDQRPHEDSRQLKRKGEKKDGRHWERQELPQWTRKDGKALWRPYVPEGT